MADEADKYQRRLQAIAEKRRLQEEEDRAKREIEDQKLRAQQLKRKSLRDQWLMDGPPSSPDSPGPNSPVLSSPTEEAEALKEKPQESPQTAEEKEAPRDQQDNDKAEEVKEAAGSPEEPSSASLENGQEEPSVLDAAAATAMSASPEAGVDSGAAALGDGPKSLQAAGEPEAQPAPEEDQEAGPAPGEAAVIPNGTQEGKEEDATDSAPEPPQQDKVANPDAPPSDAETPKHDEGGVAEGGTETTPGEDPTPIPPSSEAEPGKVLEDEDAGEVIRAERVTVTDEGDEPADTEAAAPQADAKVPAPPAESAAPPAESSTPPAESAAPPAESATPPADSSASPAESAAPPADSSAPPADSAAPPADSSAPPADSSTPPADSSTPPADSSAPPADSSAPPADSSAPPADSSAPPADGSAPPADGSAPPAESSASVEVPVPEVPKPDPADDADSVPEKEPQKEAPKDEEAEAGAETPTGAEGNVEETPAPEVEPPADSAETGPPADDSTETEPLASKVPVYPADLPSLAPQPEAEEEGGAKPKGKAPAPAVPAGKFQDIPLDGNAKPETAKEAEPEPVAGTTETPAEPSEQQTLLDPTKAAPTRAEGEDAPKRKTCQCCSVM